MKQFAGFAAMVMLVACGETSNGNDFCGSCEIFLNGSCTAVETVSDLEVCDVTGCDVVRDLFPSCEHSEPSAGPCVGDACPGNDNNSNENSNANSNSNDISNNNQNNDPIVPGENGAPLPSSSEVVRSGTGEVEIDLRELFSDPDGDTLSFSFVAKTTLINYCENHNLQPELSSFDDFFSEGGDFDVGLNPLSHPDYSTEIQQVTLEVVDVTPFSVAGLTNVDKVFRFTNNSNLPSWTVIRGRAESTNTHTISAVTRVVQLPETGADPCLEFGGGDNGSKCFENTEFQRVSDTRTGFGREPIWAILISPGTIVEFIGNELVAGDTISESVIEARGGRGFAPFDGTAEFQPTLTGPVLSVPVDSDVPRFVEVVANDGALDSEPMVIEVRAN